MTFKAVCDSWKTELQTNVTGLDTTTIPAERVHLYAPWSVELLAAQAGERHLAIWPDAEPEVVSALVTQPADQATQTYHILVWEDATATSTRLQDNEAADYAWLALYEAIRARLYLLANHYLGSVEATRYRGGEFGRSGTLRILDIRFATGVVLAYS